MLLCFSKTVISNISLNDLCGGTTEITEKHRNFYYGAVLQQSRNYVLKSSFCSLLIAGFFRNLSGYCIDPGNSVGFMDPQNT